MLTGILLIVALITSLCIIGYIVYDCVNNEPERKAKRIKEMKEKVAEFSPCKVVALTTRQYFTDDSSIPFQQNVCVVENKNGDRMELDYYSKLPVVCDTWNLKHDDYSIELGERVRY
jgi:hypothetical protein